MRLSGSFFPASTALAISGPGIATTVTTTTNQTFQVSVAVPTTPGNYTVLVTRANGAAQPGLPKIASFAVAAPATATPTPATTPAPTTTGTSPTFREPKVTRSESRGVAPTTQKRAVAPRTTQPTTNTGGVAGGGTVVTGTTGTPVFAGSVAPAAAPIAATAPAAATTAETPAASTDASTAAGRTAASDSDVWSGFAPGKTPSLTSNASAPAEDSSSSLALGLGLLALGLLALVAGLTAAEVQRRRSVR